MLTRMNALTNTHTRTISQPHSSHSKIVHHSVSFNPPPPPPPPFLPPINPYNAIRHSPAKRKDDFFFSQIYFSTMDMHEWFMSLKFITHTNGQT